MLSLAHGFSHVPVSSCGYQLKLSQAHWGDVGSPTSSVCPVECIQVLPVQNCQSCWTGWNPSGLTAGCQHFQDMRLGSEQLKLAGFCVVVEAQTEEPLKGQ